MVLFLLLTYGHEEDELKLGTVIGVIWGAGIFITFSIVRGYIMEMEKTCTYTHRRLIRIFVICAFSYKISYPNMNGSFIIHSAFCPARHCHILHDPQKE